MTTASVITCNVHLHGMEDQGRIIKVDTRRNDITVSFDTFSGDFRRVVFEQSDTPVGVEFDGIGLHVYRRTAQA